MVQINLLKGRLLSGGRLILLTQGKVAIVDDDDFCRISQYRWYAFWNKKYYYAARKVKVANGKWGVIQFMHREIFGLEYGDKRQVDHENHQTLDNRRQNLKVVSSRENHENRRNQSKHGVGVYKRGRRFAVRARIKGRYRYIGSFATAEEAQDARREAFRTENSC